MSAAPQMPLDRPVAPAPNFTTIPVELMQLNQWVLWCYELTEKGKWTKVLKRTSGSNASSTDPQTWATFATVMRVYMTQPGQFDGIGFVTATSDPTVLIDLDHVLDPESGEVVPWAQAILEAAEREGAYIEQSPSRTGFHVIGHGEQFDKGEKRNDVELYCSGRFFTITGLGVTRDPQAPLGQLTETVQLVRERLKKIEKSKAPANPTPASDSVQGTLSDDALLDQARKAKNGPKFRALFDAGDTSGYQSGSEADLALASMLAFWTGPDHGAVERLMRRSALVRDKWDAQRGQSSYLTDTITKAISERTEWHTPRQISRRRENSASAGGVSGGERQIDQATGGYVELRRDDNKKIIRDEENVLRILAQDEHLVGAVRFNEFTSELMLCRPIPATGVPEVIGERGIPRPWADTDTTAVQAYIQTRFVPGIGRDKIEAAIALHADRHGRFHPVRDYLHGLQWDRTPRLATMLATYMGATDKGQPEQFVSEVGLRWMVSAVARVMRPGCQVDHILVLEGPNQGEGKSSALRVLAGDENFSDSLPHDLSHKDAKDHTRGKWVIELPELTQFKRNEIETLKAFITRREEVFRPSYGRHEIRAPRQCVFAGTTNEAEYLVDTTGNRRFWGVAIGDIDLDGLKRDRDQLWAEAGHLYRAGERWHLTRQMEQIAAAEAGKRMATDPWAVPISRLLEDDYELSLAPELTPGAVLARMDLREAERNPNNAKRVATVLTSLGWRQGRKTMKGRCYIRPRTGAP